MNPRYQLRDAEKATVKQRLRERLADRPDVRFAYLHGSFLDACSFADIDVAVSVDADRLSSADPTTYELDLQGALERDLGLPVDVRVVEQAPTSFRHAVTRGEALFVRDPEAWALFREHTWIAYLDFAPVREEALHDLARLVCER